MVTEDYKSRMKNILGIDASAAKSILERKLILHLARQLNMAKCHHCGFDILSHEEMSIEHKTPWFGNKAIGPKKELYWDMDNIALSHKWCNSSRNAGNLPNDYLGIHKFYDKRHNVVKEYLRAQITCNKYSRTLGYYKTKQEAAIAYDLGAMLFRNGICKLNFENLREKYTEYLKNIKDDLLTNFKVRKLKPIVEYFITCI